MYNFETGSMTGILEHDHEFVVQEFSLPPRMAWCPTFHELLSPCKIVCNVTAMLQCR